MTAEFSCNIEQLPLEIEESGSVLLHSLSLQNFKLCEDRFQPFRDFLRLKTSLGDGMNFEKMVPVNIELNLISNNSNVNLTSLSILTKGIDTVTKPFISFQVKE